MKHIGFCSELGAVLLTASCLIAGQVYAVTDKAVDASAQKESVEMLVSSPSAKELFSKNKERLLQVRLLVVVDQR
jgi:hypothetical protein